MMDFYIFVIRILLVLVLLLLCMLRGLVRLGIVRITSFMVLIVTLGILFALRKYISE